MDDVGGLRAPRGGVTGDHAQADRHLAHREGLVEHGVVGVDAVLVGGSGHRPAVELHDHVPGFCADNGEIWRLMTRAEAGFGDEALGRAATLEGTAFPESGFLRANRVGY